MEATNMTSEIGFEKIKKLAFPYKLWLLIHIDEWDVLRWNEDGTIVLLDMIELDKYLHSNHTIFNITSPRMFLMYLQDFKFKPLNKICDRILKYKHEYFQRSRLYLVRCIRSYSQENVQNVLTPVQEVSYDETSAARNEDLCFKHVGSLSNIEMCRLQLKSMLEFEKNKLKLNKKLYKAPQPVLEPHAFRDSSNLDKQMAQAYQPNKQQPLTEDDVPNVITNSPSVNQTNWKEIEDDLHWVSFVNVMKELHFKFGNSMAKKFNYYDVYKRKLSERETNLRDTAKMIRNSLVLVHNPEIGS